MKDFLEEAEKIVHIAGCMAKEGLFGRDVERIKSYGDIVTKGDEEIEKFVIDSLRKLFPCHGFDAEESGHENIDAEYIWVLDPIDGTKYYAHRIPLYSISLALKQHGGEKPILGVVFAPELNRMYCAYMGKGASLNKQRIYCNDKVDIEQASICLEIPSRYSSSIERKFAMEKMSLLVEKAYRVRIIGVGSLGLCFCAEGGFDAYVNLGSKWKNYDVAAGRIILNEAGGEFLRIGQEGRLIVAGPNLLCDTIRDILKI